MKQQAGVFRCLAATDWGYEKSILRSTYIATGRSTVEYAAAAWQPCVSLSTMGKLKMCHRYAEKVITRQMKTTHVEAIYQKLTSQPLLQGPHNSAPWPWKNPFEYLIRIRESR